MKINLFEKTLIQDELANEIIQPIEEDQRDKAFQSVKVAKKGPNMVEKLENEGFDNLSIGERKAKEAQIVQLKEALERAENGFKDMTEDWVINLQEFNVPNILII